MKTLKWYLFVISCIFVCLSTHVWAAAACAPFGQTGTGMITTAGQSVSCTFSGNANDVIDWTMTVTSGNLSPFLQLFNSSGKLIRAAANRFANGACAGGAVVEMNTVLLPATDTYTLIVADCSGTNTGNYDLWSQSVLNPLGAKNLPFGTVQSGTISLAAQENTYTFSANANDSIVFTMTTSGISPRIRLYDPQGNPVFDIANRFANGACAGGSVAEATAGPLSLSGRYVLLVGDCSDTLVGSYNIYTQRTNNPTGAVPLPIGQTTSGTISSSAQSNTYEFDAKANDVVDFTMSITGGSMSPRIRLYDPTGKLVFDVANRFANGACAGGSVAEANGKKLSMAGTYLVLLGDCGDVNTGTYDVYFQRTENPSNPTTLAFGKTAAGSITEAAQSNTYTFHANASDRVDFSMTITSGNMSPRIRVYDPTGTLVIDAANRFANGACAGGKVVEANTVLLALTGTYTVLLGDCSDLNTGNYNIYMQRTNSPSGASMILLGQTQSGKVALSAQDNSYVLAASANDRFDFTMQATGFSPRIRLYNPKGTVVVDIANRFANGACAGGTTLEGDTIQLSATGTYTLLVGDCSDMGTGSYVIYGQRTNSPFGFSPMVWGGTTLPRSITSATQNNTYTFGGTANNSIDMTMVTTSGSLSPRIRLYNPDGTLVADVANRFANGACAGGATIGLNSITLTQSGIYTVMVADCSDTNTGNYNLSGQCFGTCPAMPAIHWARPASITFGTPLSAKQLNATSAVWGTFAYTPTSGTVLGVGPKNLSVVFTPTDTTTYSTAEDSVQITVNPPPSVSPTSLNFGNQGINETSAAKTVTLTNAVTGPLTISNIAASTPFAISSTTCGSTLAAGKTCTVSVTFTPTALGAVKGTLSFTDNAPNSPQKASLSGTGVEPATVTPASADYGNQKVGTTSAPKTFTLANNQNAMLSNIMISTSGNFAVSATTCSTTLAAYKSCTISVTFTPKATGTRTGSLIVSDSANNSPQTSSLSGTGD
jgi:hypothetical protein